MKVVVLEHFTSSPPSRGGAAILAEGRAMRDAIVADLVAIPGIRVTLVEGEPRSAATTGRVRTVRVGSAGPLARTREQLFRSALRDADAALVIAPEAGGLLERLARIVESEGRTLLGPAISFVRVAGDKLETFRRLSAAGVKTPVCEAIPFAAAVSRLARRRRPFVLKPRDGCGGEGVILVRPGDRLEEAIRKVRLATRRRDLLVQRFVPGAAASVALIAGGGRLLALGLCRQRLGPGRHLTYRGGEAPWRHPGAAGAVALACRAVEAIDRSGTGARGYIGIDLVVGRSGATVIEVNPRPTASYLGLRRVIRVNPARLILDAAAGRALPARVTMTGSCRFRADGRLDRGRRDGRPGRKPRKGASEWDFSAGTSAASI